MFFLFFFFFFFFRFRFRKIRISRMNGNGRGYRFPSEKWSFPFPLPRRNPVARRSTCPAAAWRRSPSPSRLSASRPAPAWGSCSDQAVQEEVSVLRRSPGVFLGGDGCTLFGEREQEQALVVLGDLYFKRRPFLDCCLWFALNIILREDSWLVDWAKTIDIPNHVKSRCSGNESVLWR